MTADSPESLESELAELASKEVLNLPEYSVAAVKRWLSQNPGWLMIMDNVDTDSAAIATQRMLSKLHGGDVLITSRIDRWGPVVEVIDVVELNPEASKAFLIERTARNRIQEPDDDHVLDEIVNNLGCLPLGLEQAGAYIDEEAITFREYQKRWEQSSETVLQWFDEQLMDYPRSVAVTWNTSVSQLSSEGSMLLSLCSLLGRAIVPFGLLCSENVKCEFSSALCNNLESQEKEKKANTSSLDLAIKQLRRYALSRISRKQGLMFHPLVQEVTATRLTKDEKVSLLDILRKWFLAYCPTTDRVPRSEWNALQIHAQAIDKQLALIRPENRDYDILDFIAQVFAAHGHYQKATASMHHSFNLKIAKLGPDHNETLASQDFLVHKHFRNGTLDEAISIAQDLLDRQIRVLGPEHHDVINTRHNIADIMLNQGKAEEACKELQLVLSFYEKSLPADHIHKLICLNDLAVALGQCKKIDEGKEMLLQALKAHERTSTMKSQNAARVLANLGEVLRINEIYTDALTYLRQALTIRKEVVGEDHPDTLNTIYDICIILFHLKEYEESNSLMWDGLARSERTLGATHSLTHKFVRSLAIELENQGNLKAAEPLFSRLIKEFEEASDDSKPDIAIELNNHAIRLRKLRYFDRAVDCLHQAIEIESRHLPTNHPKHAHRRNNLSIVLMLAGKYSEAMKINADAWQLKASCCEGGHDITSGRILFVRVALSWLTNLKANIYIGQLRTLLGYSEIPCFGGIDSYWSVDDIIGYLRTKLNEDQSDFLSVIVEAMNDSKCCDALNRFQLWVATPMVSLDTPLSELSNQKYKGTRANKANSTDAKSSAAD